MHEIGQDLSQLALEGAPDGRGEGIGEAPPALAAKGERIVAERAGAPQDGGVQDSPRAELERLEALEGLEKRGADGHDAVVLEHDHVAALDELGGDRPAELLAARNRVGRESDLAAGVEGLGKDPRIGDLAGDAEGDQGRRVRVEDGADVGPRLVDRSVEGMLARGLEDGPGGETVAEMDDVARPHHALVGAAGRYPDIADLVPDREIAARRRRHAVAVDPVHDLGDLIPRVLVVDVHSDPPPRMVGPKRRVRQYPDPHLAGIRYFE